MTKSESDRQDRGEPSRLLSGARFWLALVAGLTGVAILAGLGTWQVERLGWKEAFLARIDSRIHADPVPLDTLRDRFGEDPEVDYRPVRVSGRFIHSGERHVLSTHDREAGWNVFTPLLLDDGAVLFVNRGFVPYPLRDPALRPESLPEGLVTFTGLAREFPSEKPGSFVPENDAESDILYWREAAAMQSGLPRADRDRPVVPFIVDAASGAWGASDYPIGGTTIVSIPNNHLQYAITWYGLALVLSVMLVILVVARIRHRSHAGARHPAP